MSTEPKETYTLHVKLHDDLETKYLTVDKHGINDQTEKLYCILGDKLIAEFSLTDISSWW